MSVQILQGNCLDVLPTLPERSVQCVVTSPPYYGLRSYLPADHVDKACEVGTEEAPESYVSRMVEIFRHIRSVLHDNGTVWLNLGDSFANDTKWGGSTGGKHVAALHDSASIGRTKRVTGLKPKDLIGIPWMVAFALRADGWYLRADNVWGKPNGMPESTQDRPTRSHEYVFLLTKSQKYYYDIEAVRTAPKATTQTQLAKPYLGESTKPHATNGVQSASDIKRRIVEKQRGHSRRHPGFNDRWDAMERAEQIAEGGNLRSVWWISPAQYREAHFAVMPNALAEICIRAGSRPGDTVLDPFSGAGTTALVADRLGRHAIGIELNAEYREMSARRIADDAGLFGEVA